mgnify:CR=1 FL=1
MEILVTHKKARFNFEIGETFDAGIELIGHEVKALRAHQGSLEGAHVSVRGNEAYIIGMHIPAFQPANTPDTYDPDRNRRLLLNKKEIATLSGSERTKGLTIVPIMVYNSKRFIKVRLGIGRGKKQYDKRETIKKRDTKRDIERTLKNE